MSLLRAATASVLAWAVGVTMLHHGMNRKAFPIVPRAAVGAGKGQPGAKLFRVGYLPVTCHLTCPVAHHMSQGATSDGFTFEPVRFQGWPELKEAFLSRNLDVAFILAPMAIALREQGVPLRIVYLGHRDGTALVVGRDGPVRRVADLKGRRVAVPGRHSNQRLVLLRALKQWEMGLGDVELTELPPPDMPAALQAGAVDAIISGEPFMAQAELGGYGRVLFQAREVWPDFISCVLATREDILRDRPEDVRRLVDEIAASGRWLDDGPDHRAEAAQVVAKNYYHQDPKLLHYVLSRPPDRVRYTDLGLRRADFAEIEALGHEAGLLKGTAHFDDYADPSFSTPDGIVTARALRSVRSPR